ncbi:unnamed protein product [Heterobilharzia americana]|nr:unnamed protein product [Heterobilharzia americana]
MPERENTNEHVTETELTCRLFCTPKLSVSGKLDGVELGIPFAANCSNAVTSTGESWRTHPIEVFQQHLSSNNDIKKMSKQVVEFYRRQDEHIHQLEKIAASTDSETSGIIDVSTNTQSIRQQARRNSIILRVIFFANVLLLLGKAMASALSGSLAIISSLLDSCVDLASGGIMWYASHQMRKKKPYKYPQGRTRLEPIAVIVLAVFMASISLQLIAESIQAIVRMSQNKQGPPNVNNLTLGIMAAVIGVKLCLWIMCIKFGSGMGVDALKADQRNDIISNAASMLFGGLGGRLQQYENLKYLDPIGAVLIGTYILYSWYHLGAEQIRNLAGHTADPHFIQMIAFVCLNYHPLIERLDTIRAFHFGAHFLVEVDIVLPKEMCLKDAHDIGEGLQKRLERLQTVERAFVHLDYEYTHHPESEHKIA